MNLSSPATSRRVAFAAFVALLALASAVAATPASAKAKGCAEQVVTDWFNHKDKIQGHYPLHCYSDALGSLDPSVDTYTNARAAISAALAAETLRRGGSGPSNPDGSSSSKLRPGEKPIARRNTYDFGTSSDPGTGPIDTIRVSSASPSSVPVPLIVLAGLAVVLLLAGAGSYAARRVKANRTPPPATDTSP